MESLYLLFHALQRTASLQLEAEKVLLPNWHYLISTSQPTLPSTKFIISMIPPMPLYLEQCFQLMESLCIVWEKIKQSPDIILPLMRKKVRLLARPMSLKKSECRTMERSWPQYQMLLNTQSMLSIILSLGHFRPLKKSRQSFHLWPWAPKQLLCSIWPPPIMGW